MSKDNVSLGNFNLLGIPPAPRGVPQIEVTFDIDANGILNVSAKDLGTGKEQKMQITASTKLSDKDIQKMMQEAKEHEEEDKKIREKIEAKNRLDSLIYSCEKVISESGDKLNKEQKEKVESSIKSAKEVLKKDNLEDIKKETETLQKAMQEASTKLYEEAAKKYAEEHAKENQEFGKDNSNNSNKRKKKKSDSEKDEAIDAEYEVKDEK